MKPIEPRTESDTLRVVLLYRRHQVPDEHVLHLLEKRLAADGYEVFVDRHITFGVDWAREIEGQIRTADVVVPLLSEAAIQSEMMEFEIANAREAAETNGRPRFVPVRIKYSGVLPSGLADILDPLPAIHWKGPEDDGVLVDEIFKNLRSFSSQKPTVRIAVSKGIRLPPRPASANRNRKDARPALVLEPIGGAVALTSDFYLVRPGDAEVRKAMARYDSIILIKGARQMGKTSLLARALQYARERGARVALTDFQKFNSANLDSIEHFYISLGESLADQLDLDVMPSDTWDVNRSPNVNFERYVRREVLAKLHTPLVWGLDEVDRLFVSDYGSEVFGLFRSWHNERALDPSGPWAGLTLAIAYATEAHLFIRDMNQSPFNVGTRVTLEDFSPDQVAELNRRNGNPLKNSAELTRFIHLVGGHPFLVRRGLHEMATRNLDITAFEAQADREEGVFGDHLRRMLVLLAKDPALSEVIKIILSGGAAPTQESFYRLRSAGVMAGESPRDLHPRCKVYQVFLARHLLPGRDGAGKRGPESGDQPSPLLTPADK